MRPPETFATARLTARPPRVDDAFAVFAAYAGDPEATRYLNFPTYTAVEPVMEYLSSTTTAWAETGGHFPWMLCIKDTDTPIGSIGVTPEDGKAMFGYVLGRPHWGQGYAAEALTYLVDWSLAQPGIWRAWAYCHAENTASVRVMEKAGLRREALLRRWHVFPNLGTEPQDCIMCAKTK